jgi:LmbE family N-acetylglucosaminyl deacetylase
MTSPAILSPHFDDAVLSCWNVLDQPEEACVITVFGGVPDAGTSTSWDQRCGQPDSQALVHGRIKENEVALNAAKARAVNLPHLDGQYPHAERDVSAIAETVLELTDQDATIYAPIAIAGLRQHQDHITVQQTAKQLLEQGRDVAFYADLPYAIPLLGERKWPALRSAARIGRAVGLKLEAETVELNPDQQASKAKVLRDYTSQFSALSEIRGGLLKKRYFYRYEMLFRPV